MCVCVRARARVCGRGPAHGPCTQSRRRDPESRPALVTPPPVPPAGRGTGPEPDPVAFINWIADLDVVFFTSISCMYL